jgi:hypothetical protein
LQTKAETILGEKMPRKKKEGFGIGDVLMLIALLLFLWLVLKTLKFIDPPEEYSMYILEAILGIMITAWFTDIRDFKKKTINQGEMLVEIKTKVGYLEKNLEELKK